jgi:glycosyltransferase involved in cell wall biosynthesis
MGLKLPCAVSGIYFRPTFHYNHFAHHSSSLKDQIQQWRERIVLSRAFSHPQFKVLFCLDPFAVSHLRKIHDGAQAVHLPDPVMSCVTSEDHLHHLRQKLGIAPDRQVFLLFGRLDGRKGIHQLLQAVSDLPENLSKKLCLLLVGPIGSNDKLLITPKLAEISQTSSVQIITSEQFVPDHEIQPYFQIADVVLAPYQRHVGMSAILIRAAAAQKPVLTSNYGLMGEVTRQHQLGLAIDSTNPQEIANGLARFLLESPDKFCDRAKMQMFAAENSPERFAAVIFQNL